MVRRRSIVASVAKRPAGPFSKRHARTTPGLEESVPPETQCPGTREVEELSNWNGTAYSILHQAKIQQIVSPSLDADYRSSGTATLLFRRKHFPQVPERETTPRDFSHVCIMSVAKATMTPLPDQQPEVHARSSAASPTKSIAGQVCAVDVGRCIGRNASIANTYGPGQRVD